MNLGDLTITFGPLVPWPVLAGLAGLMAAPIVTVSIGMGDNILILAFVIIVIGGIGSIKGAFIAAIIVGMSVRTLQRRLAETGVSYSDLVDEVRLASALTLIDDRSIRLSDVARRLGYADAANFDRAFRRWTGFSPSQVRALDRQSRIDLTRKRHVGSP